MERAQKNQKRQDAQRQFGSTAGPSYVGRVGYRGAFHRPRPYRPYSSNPYGEPFLPRFNPSHDYRNGFFSPPRGRSLQHDIVYGEFTPPRPFHGAHRGGRQSSKQWGRQQDTGNGHTKFNSHKYFKESMLEDPWKELIEKKQEQISDESN